MNWKALSILLGIPVLTFIFLIFVNNKTNLGSNAAPGTEGSYASQSQPAGANAPDTMIF
jgi:hypothetical protein